MPSSLRAIHCDPTANKNTGDSNLPLGSMVRALCEAAAAGPQMLYEAMLKLALMVDMTAPTYGLATWSQEIGERPSLKWAEGLNADEIIDAEKVVRDALAAGGNARRFKAG